MESFMVVIFLFLGLLQATAHPVDPTFQHLVCQRCNSMCTEGGLARVGKVGPKGDAGPRGQIGQPGHIGARGQIGLPGPIGFRGPVGRMNATEFKETVDQKFERSITAINVMVDREILKVVRNLSTTNCQSIRMEKAKSTSAKGGVFDIYIPEIGFKEVSCDVRTDGGNWIVFQRRMDGSVNFYRYWNDYVNGFGSTSSEFWLGLEAIHQLTKIGQHELRMEITMMDGRNYYVKYSSFKVESASYNYKLRVSGYSGNVVDAFANVHDNMYFSTRDRDNDRWEGHCARDHNAGGWWYNKCYSTNPNGMYGVRTSQGLEWYPEGHMSFTEMKIRPKQ